MNETVVAVDSKKHAAQNAREGLITVNDLSHLTGLSVPQLTKLAKTGFLQHYGEYHGKRFYDFNEVVAWALTGDDPSRATLRGAIEAQLALADCPYALERVSVEGQEAFRFGWRELPMAA
jgi:hypothetical protein